MSTTATQIITLAKTKHTPYVVGICGGSASGKSSFGSELMDELVTSGCAVSVINQDDFAIGRHFGGKNTSPYRWDDPDNYRLQECFQSVDDLENGQPASFMAYTLHDHEPSTHKTIESQADTSKPYIIIVEGIFAWYGPMAAKVDYKIYLDVDFYRRFILRLNRNVYESQHTDADTVIRQYFTHVALAEKDLLVPLKYDADAVISHSIPLPAPNVGVQGPVDYNIVYENDELMIGITNGSQRNLLVYVNGNLAFDVPIKDESAELMTRYKHGVTVADTRADQSLSK